jgi:Zn-dependent metalloprotease
MLGTYIESVVQGGNIDWIIGDDLPTIAQAIGRDLKNPQYNCFTDANANAHGDEHTRSQPLGHWFYLLSQGGSNNGVLIPALGIKKALQIVLESLNGIDPKGDYPQLREKTIVAVEKHFGPCSDEAIAVRNAWEAICIGKAEVPENCYTIRGISTVCEEGEDLSLCTIGGVAGGSFQWTFPRDWRVEEILLIMEE